MKKKWELPEEVRRPKEELEAFLARVLERLGAQDHAIARAHVETVAHLLDVLQQKNLSLKRLRAMLFGAKSEKSSEVLEPEEAAEKEEGKEEAGAQQPEKKRKGHGRNGISEYPGANEVQVPHATLHSRRSLPVLQEGEGLRHRAAGDRATDQREAAA